VKKDQPRRGCLFIVELTPELALENWTDARDGPINSFLRSLELGDKHVPPGARFGPSAHVGSLDPGRQAPENRPVDGIHDEP
jgi:hypothetical protein